MIHTIKNYLVDFCTILLIVKVYLLSLYCSLKQKSRLVSGVKYKETCEEGALKQLQRTCLKGVNPWMLIADGHSVR